MDTEVCAYGVVVEFVMGVNSIVVLSADVDSKDELELVTTDKLELVSVVSIVSEL